MFGHKKNTNELFSAMLPSGYQKLHVTTTEITLKDVTIPLIGARAEVETDRGGAFHRTTTTIFTITAANGMQIVYTYGGTFGTKGAASRSTEVMLRKLAAKVNNAAITAAM